MFNPEQKSCLAAPLNSQHVKSREQGGRVLSYIEGWHAIAEANRIFGFDGWMRETIDIRMVSEAPRKVGKTNPKDGFGVTYVARVRITVGGIVREGVGAGHGIDVDLGQAHESAIKEAETDAMKRAFMTFGNPFGLALYDKSQANVSSGPSPVLEALLANIPKTTRADAVAWKDKQKEQIDSLSQGEFETFKAAWTAALKTFATMELA